MAEPVNDPAASEIIEEAPAVDIDEDPTTDEPGFELDEQGLVAVAGLLLPPALALQIVEAMRALYPSITTDLSNAAAVRAVLKHWVTVTLETYAAQQATGQVTEQVVQLQAQAQEKGRKARDKATEAAQAIREVNTPAKPAPPTKATGKPE